MAKAIKIDNLKERGLMEDDEADNLAEELQGEAETAARAEQEAAGLAPPPPEQQAPPPEQQAPPGQEPQQTGETDEQYSTRVRERIHELVEARKSVEADRDRARQEAQDLREKWARLDERRAQADQAAQLFEQRRAVEQRQAERPDPAIDPQAAKIWDLEEKNRIAEERLVGLERRFIETGQQTQATLQQQQMLNYLRDDVGRFEREHGDYQQAARYAADKRTQFWMNLGRTQEEARSIVDTETAAIVESGFRTGKSTASTVYQLATEWGYKATNGAAAATQNGGLTPAAPEGPVSDQERLRQVAAGQKVQGRPRTATEVGEGSDIAKLSAAQIAAMDEDVYMRIISTPAGARAMNQRMRELELQ